MKFIFMCYIISDLYAHLFVQHDLLHCFLKIISIFFIIIVIHSGLEHLHCIRISNHKFTENRKGLKAVFFEALTPAWK